jgi:hypothetical protein
MPFAGSRVVDDGSEIVVALVQACGCEKEVGHGLADGECVQGHHAGCGYTGDVPGLLAFGLGVHLDGEFGLTSTPPVLVHAHQAFRADAVGLLSTATTRPWAVPGAA